MKNPPGSWKRMLALAAGVCIFFVVVLWLIMFSYTGPYMGEVPKFSFMLMDNGENDYIDIKFISAGTEFFEVPVPLSLENFEIRIEQENFISALPPTNMFLGDSERVFFNVDVIERGEVYEVVLVNLLTYGVYVETVTCE